MSDPLEKRLQQFIDWYEDGTITTSDNGYGRPEETHPQGIEGPYELYGLFDDGFDGNGGLLGDVVRELERAKKIEDAAREMVKQRHGTQKDRHAATAALAAALTPDNQEEA